MRGDDLGPGPQVEMVGVGEQQLNTGPGHHLGSDALDGRLGADRHEGRGVYDPVGGGVAAEAGAAALEENLEGEP